MGAREATHVYRLHHWAEKIGQCHSSGMTVTAWCESQNINIKSYYYWQKQVREAASAELMNVQNCSSKQGLVPNGWAQVSEPALSACENVLTIEISGCRITANDKTDSELLTKVCRILRLL